MLNRKGEITLIELIALVGIILIGLIWYSHSRERKLYNHRFGTNYSTADFFWAGDTIKDYIQKGEHKTHYVRIIKDDISIEEQTEGIVKMLEGLGRAFSAPIE